MSVAWPIPKARFEPWQTVYLRANTEMKGTVTGLIIRAGCAPQYIITWGEDASEGIHWEGELTEDKDYSA